MPGAFDDLWPKEVEVTDLLSPLVILRYQAQQLKKRTKGILEGDVQTHLDVENKYASHSFDLIAPALDGYRYRLFFVWHDSEMFYPVEVHAQCLLKDSVRAQLESDPSYIGEIRWPRASTQEEFVEFVRQVLHSPETKSVIQSLIARSNDVTRERQTAKTVKSEPK